VNDLTYNKLSPLNLETSWATQHCNQVRKFNNLDNSVDANLLLLIHTIILTAPLIRLFYILSI